MKKLFLFLFGIFATSYVAYSQITADSFTQPANTGANQTLGIQGSNPTLAATLGQFVGGQLGAFYDLDGDGTLECVGLETIIDGFFGLALWGDDSSTPEADGLPAGGQPTFAILTTDGYVIDLVEIPEFSGYVTNGIAFVEDVNISYYTCDDPTSCNYSADFPYVVDQVISSCDGQRGCMDEAYVEYSPSATCDPDDACQTLIVVGCMDPSACSYDPAANVDDPASCSGVSGCTDANYLEFNPSANCDDGSCSELVVLGCTDAEAFNYSMDANVDDGSCVDVVEGCTQAGAFNFNPGANVDDGSCIDVVEGCTNPGAENYNPDANTDDGTCIAAALCFTVDPDFPCEEITSNNMSVLFPASNPALWNDLQSNVEVNDQIAAFYVTGTLSNEELGYSATSSVENAGGLVWSGGQVGAAIFGADANAGNGFQPGEELVWLVLRAGVVHEASVTYATPNYDGTYQDGSFVTVNSIVVGGPLLEGCMNSNYMEYDPMATSSDPDDCITLISVGCLDDNLPNYAGSDLDVNSIHPNALNYGNAFGENYMINLNTGLPDGLSGVPALFHDADVCQTKLTGCTYPYASNYDAFATEDDGSCDFSSYSYYELEGANSEPGALLYSFGGDDNPNNMDWVGSDFAHANTLYQDGRMGTGHIITDLIESYNAYTELFDNTAAAAAAAADAAAADAAAAAALLQSTIDSANTAFADDEALDLMVLNNTVAEMQADADAAAAAAADLLSSTTADYEAQLSAAAADAAAAAAAADALLAQTVSDAAALAQSITDSLNYHRAPIYIDLHSGWNTIAYYLHHESPVVAQFENQFETEENVQSNINIVKNNEGMFYWPDFMFDGLGMLQPGQGYQVRVKDGMGKSNFFFDHSLTGDDYRLLNSSIPAWAVEMPVDNHPNDIKTLIRVVNMLGQEVSPSEQFKGEVLLYLYNDGTVEKRIVE
jgi:hypothetical protein